MSLFLSCKFHATRILNFLWYTKQTNNNHLHWQSVALPSTLSFICQPNHWFCVFKAIESETGAQDRSRHWIGRWQNGANVVAQELIPRPLTHCAIMCRSWLANEIQSFRFLHRQSMNYTLLWVVERYSHRVVTPLVWPLMPIVWVTSVRQRIT